MIETDPQSLVQLIRDGGAILLLAVAIIGGMRGWYVWKRELDRADAATALEAQRADEWQAIALDLLRQSDRATSIAERAVGAK
jgi:hypothetical protein